MPWGLTMLHSPNKTLGYARSPAVTTSRVDGKVTVMRLLERPTWMKGIVLALVVSMTLLLVVILFNLATGIESDQALFVWNKGPA